MSGRSLQVLVLVQSQPSQCPPCRGCYAGGGGFSSVGAPIDPVLLHRGNFMKQKYKCDPVRLAQRQAGSRPFAQHNEPTFNLHISPFYF